MAAATPSSIPRAGRECESAIVSCQAQTKRGRRGENVDVGLGNICLMEVKSPHIPFFFYLLSCQAGALSLSLSLPVVCSASTVYLAAFLFVSHSGAHGWSLVGM